MTNSDVTALVALIVAALAMGATFWQAHVARSHSRISVRPHLDWGTDRFPGRPVILYLVNNGLGPAIIDSLALTLDGKKFPIGDMDLPSELRNAVTSISGHTEWNLFSKGTPIAHNTRINLLFFEDQSLGLMLHNQAIALLNRIGVEIHYSSMYGESFVLRKP